MRFTPVDVSDGIGMFTQLNEHRHFLNKEQKRKSKVSKSVLTFDMMLKFMEHLHHLQRVKLPNPMTHSHSENQIPNILKCREIIIRSPQWH